LQTYCDTKHIPYGLDETNELDIYERNVIRKQLKQLTPLQFNRQYNHFVKINKINEVLMHKVQIAYQL
jgi:tRNA(Ile)-lysidine synthase